MKPGNGVQPVVKSLIAFLLITFGLSLAACGKKDESAAPTGAPIAAVAPPTGTTWSDTITLTSDGHFLMGNPNAKLKLVEFGSYTCPHCRDFATEAFGEIKGIVDSGKMNFEFRPFLRDPIDLTSALLARCGGKDVFYPMTEQLYANQAAMFDKAQANQAAMAPINNAPAAQRPQLIANALGLVDFVKQRGIAEDQAKQCLADTATAEKLAKDVEAASQQYQINGTPSFLINGVLSDVPPTWKDVHAELRRAGV
jgi:protein-disulfide isomerase